MKDAFGNSTLTGDKHRFHIGAGYLRLAAQQSAALADLIDAVANQDRTPGRRAIKRLAEIDRAIEKHLAMVAVDNERWARERNSVRVQVSGDDFEKLMRGEHPELIAKIEAAKAGQEPA